MLLIGNYDDEKGSSGNDYKNSIPMKFAWLEIVLFRQFFIVN